MSFRDYLVRYVFSENPRLEKISGAIPISQKLSGAMPILQKISGLLPISTLFSAVLPGISSLFKRTVDTGK